MQYATLDGHKSMPSHTGQRAECPSCGGEVLSKCGNINIHHWAHLSGKECDPWVEHETEWHREWKNQFPPECREVTIHSTDSDEFHRADVCLPNGKVIEFQHSTIPDHVVLAREDFYTKYANGITWVVDGAEFMKRWVKFPWHRWVNDRHTPSWNCPFDEVYTGSMKSGFYAEQSSMAKKGTVKWFDEYKGYGFIATENSWRGLFVHHSDISTGASTFVCLDGIERKYLNAGQTVEFEVGQTEKGPCAKQVVGISGKQYDTYKPLEVRCGPDFPEVAPEMLKPVRWPHARKPWGISQQPVYFDSGKRKLTPEKPMITVKKVERALDMVGERTNSPTNPFPGDVNIDGIEHRRWFNSLEYALYECGFRHSGKEHGHVVKYDGYKDSDIFEFLGTVNGGKDRENLSIVSSRPCLQLPKYIVGRFRPFNDVLTELSSSC